MRFTFRSFALRCQRVIRRCLRKLAKHFRDAWLCWFFVSALRWVDLAWANVVQWYAPPRCKMRNKARGGTRSLGFATVRGEALEPRRCLSDLYWGGGSSGAWVSTTANWHLGSPTGGLVTWTNVDPNNSTANAAHIAGASGTVSIAIAAADNVSPAAIYFGDSGMNASCNISGGTITLSGATPIYVYPNTTAATSSAIAGSAYELLIPDYGTLNLTGNVTVAGIQELHGTLALNGTTTITNLDKTGDGLWVENDATILGSGALTLLDQPDQTTPTPFKYASSSTISEYDGPISGDGGLTVNAGTLTVGSNANVYRGGTYIGCQSNTVTTSPILRLTKGAGGAPATLGSGDFVIFGLHGTLDLNGCPFTLTLLKEDGKYNKVQNGSGAFWWAGGVNQLAA